MHASNQLTTAHLFYATVLCASAVSLFGALGLLVAVFVAGVWWQVLAGAIREHSSTTHVGSRAGPLECESQQVRDAHASTVSRGFSRIELVAVLILVAILLGLMMPPKSDFDAMQQAKNSMQQIAQAVEAYEVKHGCKLPPVISRDGKPMHSWRAMILNELGEKKLASAYRMDEPWNGPNNITLSDFRPWHYQPFYPSELAQASLSTGSGGDRSLTCVHLLHSENGHAALVEHEQFPAHWLRPSQLTAEELEASNRVPGMEKGFWQPGILVSHFRGRVAVRGKEVVAYHPGAAASAIMHGASTANGSIGQSVGRYHFSRLLRTLAFVMVALYPLRWLRRIQSANS